MDWLKERLENLKKDFLKKKSEEKFEYLYDKIDEVEDKIDQKECDYSCDCDDNSDWIEKIKYEQENFNNELYKAFSLIAELEEKVELLEDSIEDAEEGIKILEKNIRKNNSV